MDAGTPRKGNEHIVTSPLITRVEPLRPRGLRVRVHLDRGEALEVAQAEAVTEDSSSWAGARPAPEAQRARQKMRPVLRVFMALFLSR